LAEIAPGVPELCPDIHAHTYTQTSIFIDIDIDSINILNLIEMIPVSFPRELSLCALGPIRKKRGGGK
jgi:hypothetical protein